LRRRPQEQLPALKKFAFRALIPVNRFDDG
jgi:hypothetical protein